MAYPTDAEVNRLIKLWKKRLGLQGVDIGWRWAKQSVIQQGVGYSAIASTEYDGSEVRALISFSSDTDWTDGQFYSDHNLEDTVVHELLHIRFAHAEDKLNFVGEVLLPLLSPDNGRIVGALMDSARERYIEAARTVIQEAQWKQ